MGQIANQMLIEAVLKLKKKLANGNPELMAVHLCLPITVWINLCDREPDREEEVLEMEDRIFLAL